MKWVISVLVLTSVASPAVGQQRYYGGQTNQTVVYFIDLTPQNIRSSGLSGSNIPTYNPLFDGGRGAYRSTLQSPTTRGTSSRCQATGATSQCSQATSGSHGYTRPVAVSELSAMNRSFVRKAQSLPPRLYSAFSKVANDMTAQRAAMLRRLVFELPSRIEGTTYIPPSPKSMMQAMRKVVYSTDAQVDAYWRNQ